MLKMKWMTDNEGRLVATWTETRRSRAIPAYLQSLAAAQEAEAAKLRKRNLRRPRLIRAGCGRAGAPPSGEHRSLHGSGLPHDPSRGAGSASLNRRKYLWHC